MSISLRKHLAKLLATTILVSAAATVSAAALDQPVAVLSSKLNSSVGTVLTLDQIQVAQQTLAEIKAAANANKGQDTNKQPVAVPPVSSNDAAVDDTEAETPVLDYDALQNAPVDAKPVIYSSSLTASSTIKDNATSLGNYKLTFYCPCEICNGHSHGTTASGTSATEGRTIAVDSSVIPMGSRVYIEGFGMFIAEDTGGAIKNNKIDIFVSSHERAYELGVKYADVYLLD